MKTSRMTPAFGAPVGKAIVICFATLFALIVISCEQQDATPGITADETSKSNTDAVADSYYDDADDVADSQLESDDAGSSGGKVSTDERLACAVVTRQGDATSGTLRIDFGKGCTDPRGNTRRGAIVIARTGRFNQVGAHWTISFDGYAVNNVGVEGKRTVTVVSATDSLIVSDVVLTGGRLTWSDGSTATREAHRRREHERHGNHLLDRLIIYGTASGTLRSGEGYTIEILERLIYRRACAALGILIPSSGIKLIKSGERELTVDYGDGTCDNFVTLTNKNGRSVRYEVGSK